VEQNKVVVAAKAGTHSCAARQVEKWIQAFAGMTAFVIGTFAAAAEAPPGASSCSGCHPTSAAVETPVSRLVGRPAAEIVAAMQAFRSGQLPASVMDRIAKGFSEDEIAAIAAWYAAQKD
jgi:cytochrome subunit of sulfide dehydrogenase